MTRGGAILVTGATRGPALDFPDELFVCDLAGVDQTAAVLRVGSLGGR